MITWVILFLEGRGRKILSGNLRSRYVTLVGFHATPSSQRDDKMLESEVDLIAEVFVRKEDEEEDDRFEVTEGHTWVWMEVPSPIFLDSTEVWRKL